MCRFDQIVRFRTRAPCQKARKEHDTATAQAINDLLKEELLSSQLDIKDMMGLATDGASVMVGTRQGVASKLKQDNPCIIAIQSNLDYPDLDYPDYSIIRTFFSGPNFFMNIN